MTIRSVSSIEEELRDNAESIGRELLSGAHKEGAYLKAGSIMGNPGGSLVLNLQGNRAGLWRDYAGTDHGDMLDLIQQSQGLDKAGAVAWAKDRLGIVDDFRPGAPKPDAAALAARAAELAARQRERAAKDAVDKAARIRGAKALYLSPGPDGSRPIAGTPVEAYLTGRKLAAGESGEWPGCLRYHPQVFNKAERVKMPAMLAPIFLADGQQVATHRTYLQACPRRGWTKIDSKLAKMVLGPMGGGFVPINKGASGKPMSRMAEGEAVYVTEGIEDALVVRMTRPALRIVAAVTLGNIGAIVLPEAARRIVIVADRDDNADAQEALERSIAAQQARGLDVRIVMPPLGCKDMNDWLRAGMEGRAA